MPVAKRPRLFSPRFALLLAAFAGLTSSCQSSRPSFAFQPAPGRSQSVAAAPLAASQDSVSTIATPVTAVHIPQCPAQMGSKEQQPAPITRMAAVAKAVVTPKIERPVTVKRRALLQRPHTTAEAGLGTTVLGVLGLIALPIAALGLILSGGALGWIIVGGLAVLAVLVAYIDPDGR